MPVAGGQFVRFDRIRDDGPGQDVDGRDTDTRQHGHDQHQGQPRGWAEENERNHDDRQEDHPGHISLAFVGFP